MDFGKAKIEVRRLGMSPGTGTGTVELEVKDVEQPVFRPTGTSGLRSSLKLSSVEAAFGSGGRPAVERSGMATEGGRIEEGGPVQGLKSSAAPLLRDLQDWLFDKVVSGRLDIDRAHRPTE
jgi:hypothetical protein